MFLKNVNRAAAVFLALVSTVRAAGYELSSVAPPKPLREFRGLWIATVGNIDWPSEPGLDTADQKRELLAILDRAARLKLNAIIFQVRPACDAFYASPIEPWSEYLTGKMGRAPEPYYDPLAFVIEEAHRRGMELHAWFNPYRALHKSHEGKVSASHISKTHPQLVKSYGEYLWLDPGEPEVQNHSLKVVMDVVRRYDVDGVQFDDYFYPDPAEAGGLDFPDDPSWARIGSRSHLSCDDWRRENVNTFVQRVYRSVKAAKPWVKFGISPPGIWRPGSPAQIKGGDNFEKLYADSRKWLVNGWVDYFSPQLYWPIAPKEQSFPVLLKWWAEQNDGRHLWPGLAAYKTDEWGVEEIVNQVRLVRKQPGATGCAFYNTSCLMSNAALMERLRREVFTEAALVPASPWLGPAGPGKPTVQVRAGLQGPPTLSWSASGTNHVRQWLLQTRAGSNWTSEVLPAGVRFRVLYGAGPELLAVTAIDRSGNASVPVVLRKQAETVPPKRRTGR